MPHFLLFQKQTFCFVMISDWQTHCKDDTESNYTPKEINLNKYTKFKKQMIQESPFTLHQASPNVTTLSYHGSPK